uniref:UGP3 n=1 Tax=Arundo donax TaxID=35708 RepID=A0A0A9CR98_ARUDO
MLLEDFRRMSILLIFVKYLFFYINSYIMTRTVGIDIQVYCTKACPLIFLQQHLHAGLKSTKLN